MLTDLKSLFICIFFFCKFIIFVLIYQNTYIFQVTAYEFVAISGGLHWMLLFLARFIRILYYTRYNFLNLYFFLVSFDWRSSTLRCVFWRRQILVEQVNKPINQWRTIRYYRNKCRILKKSSQLWIILARLALTISWKILTFWIIYHAKSWCAYLFNSDFNAQNRYILNNSLKLKEKKERGIGHTRKLEAMQLNIN